MGRNYGANCSPKGELSAKLTEGVNPPRRRPPPARFAVHLPLMRRNYGANCSPKGELSAKPTEGVNGLPAPPHSLQGLITARPAALNALVSLEATANPFAAAIAAM